MNEELLADSPKSTQEFSKHDHWSCWKLRSENSRQTWHFHLPEHLKDVIRGDEDWAKPEGQQFLEGMMEAFAKEAGTNANSSDLVYRYQMTGEVSEGKLRFDEGAFLGDQVNASLKEGWKYFERLQQPTGNWPSDYGGPMFLIPGLITVSYITEAPLPIPQQKLIIQYLYNQQNEDGGWGLHIEGHSTMFGTVMNYVALRLLGVEECDERASKARTWIKQHGGATSIPPWGKFYLSVLGIYDWAGNDSLFPELWILPKWLPMHPGNYWCHARMVYLPMSYAYGIRITAPESDLTHSLREEIYTEDYAKVDWKAARGTCHELDEYTPVDPLFTNFSKLTSLYEQKPIKSLRKKALKFASDYVDAEDDHTVFVDIGPVNQVINSLVVWHNHGKDSERFKKHVERWQDYLWVAEDGLKVNGYNGSQLWDTAFASQALVESGLSSEFEQLANNCYDFFDEHQIKRNPRDAGKFFRDPSVGGWAFSTSDQGWPVTDCTTEGMKSALMLNKIGVGLENDEPIIDLHRLKPTIELLLNLQNKNGGWASYEKTRGPKWVEKLNPARVFNDIMIEYPYVECTSATMQGLRKFREIHPGHRGNEIDAAIQRGVQFIKNEQRPDGSWYGSWGVCFTYATWFGVEGLIAGGEAKDSSEILKACEFLVSKQNEDGSWGESFESCVKMEYVQHEDGQIINTAWALLALMAAEDQDQAVIESGIRFLMSRQMSNGDFPQEAISGVFNKNCMESYTAYRNVFPLWALGRYRSER